MFAVCLFAFSLQTPRNDTLAPADTARPALAAIKPAFNLDFRDSFLERQHVNVLGINAGIEFGVKRHQLTLGYYWINYATYLATGLLYFKPPSTRISTEVTTASV